nr:hypothetical protein [Tanacetum cinerariifolium]
MSTQQDIHAAGSESRPPMLNKENYVPWTRMIPEPGDINREVPVNETFHVQTDDALTEKELKQIEIRDPLALMANSNNPYAFPVPHQDQPSYNQNYMQQSMPNPEDITDPTTAMNMALALMAKAFKLNYSTPTNNNQRISSNPRNRQIAQSGMNMGQDKQIQMVGGNANLNGNGNLVAARAEGNAFGHNGNQIRCYNCRGKEEAGIQLQAKEFDLMATAADLDEIEEGKKKTQNVTQPEPKSQGPEAFGALTQKGKNTKTKKTSLGNTQLAVKGLPSLLDEGTRSSKPLTEGKLIDAKDPRETNNPLVWDHLPLTLMKDELKDDTDEEIYEAREDMDEEIQQTAAEETQSPEPSKEQPTEQDHLERSKENSPFLQSLDFKSFDNYVPTIERVLAKTIQNFNSFLYAQLSEDNWEKYKEAKASYADLRAAVEGFAAEANKNRNNYDIVINSVIENTLVNTLISQCTSISDSLKEKPEFNHGLLKAA